MRTRVNPETGVPDYRLVHKARKGDVYRGPRGGLRTIIGWESHIYSREMEAHAWLVGAPAPGAARPVRVRFGERGRCLCVYAEDMDAWMLKASLVLRGEGSVWPYVSCDECHGVGLVWATWSGETLRNSEVCSTCKGASWT